MSQLNASPLHVISALIYLPAVYVNASAIPAHLTKYSTELLFSLCKDPQFAYEADQEARQFIEQHFSELSEEELFRGMRYFILRIYMILGDRHRTYQSISYIYTQALSKCEEETNQKRWEHACRLLHLAFEKFGIIDPDSIESLDEEEPMDHDQSSDNQFDEDEDSDMEDYEDDDPDPISALNLLNRYK